MGTGLGHGGKNHHEKKPQAPSSKQGGGCAPGITLSIISTTIFPCHFQGASSSRVPRAAFPRGAGGALLLQGARSARS